MQVVIANGRSNLVFLQDERFFVLFCKYFFQTRQTHMSSSSNHTPSMQDQDYRQIMEELKNLSPTQIEQRITQMIGMGQTLQLAEEQELLECERLGILDLINDKTN